MASETETRTYALTGAPETLDKIEQLLAIMRTMSVWGSSRMLVVPWDGDGAERLRDVKPEVTAKGLSEALATGHAVHVSAKGAASVRVTRRD